MVDNGAIVSEYKDNHTEILTKGIHQFVVIDYFTSDFCYQFSHELTEWDILFWENLLNGDSPDE